MMIPLPSLACRWPVASREMSDAARGRIYGRLHVDQYRLTMYIDSHEGRRRAAFTWSAANKLDATWLKP